MAWRKGSAHATTNLLIHSLNLMEQLNQNTQPQGNNSQMPKPDNNMVMAILCTVCCCLPFGIYAIIKASKVNGFYVAGMYNEAVSAANEAKKWSTIGIITGLVIQAAYMAFSFFVLGATID